MKFFQSERLVTDVSWNVRVKEKINLLSAVPSRCARRTNGGCNRRIDRVQDFPKASNAFVARIVFCHVLRDHQCTERFHWAAVFDPRSLRLEMPRSIRGRTEECGNKQGIGLLKHHKMLHKRLPESIKSPITGSSR